MTAGIPRTTALFDAIHSGLAHLDGGAKTRKVLIVVSDGGDNASHATYRDVLDAALRRDVVIYTVGIYDDYDKDAKPAILRELAAATGGEACFPRKLEEVAPALERIARDIRSSYTIGYLAPPESKASARTIRVDVHPAGGRKLSVRTRSAYIKDSVEARRGGVGGQLVALFEGALYGLATVALLWFAGAHIAAAREQAALADELERSRATLHTPRHGPRSAPPAPRALVGRIEVPRLQLSALAHEGVDTGTLSGSAGHVPGSALPGEAGNAAFAAHRDTFFRPLKGVRNGDQIAVTTIDGEFRYVASGTRVVDPLTSRCCVPETTRR